MNKKHFECKRCEKILCDPIVMTCCESTICKSHIFNLNACVICKSDLTRLTKKFSVCQNLNDLIENDSFLSRKEKELKKNCENLKTYFNEFQKEDFKNENFDLILQAIKERRAFLIRKINLIANTSEKKVKETKRKFLEKFNSTLEELKKETENQIKKFLNLDVNLNEIGQQISRIENEFDKVKLNFENIGIKFDASDFHLNEANFGSISRKIETTSKDVKGEDVVQKENDLNDINVFINENYQHEGTLYDDSNDENTLSCSSDLAKSNQKRKRRFSVPTSISNSEENSSSVLDGKNLLKFKMTFLIKFLLQLPDSNGRILSKLFLQLPKRREHLDYYKVVKKPIDLKTIQQRIRNNKYHTLDELQTDFDLICKNAKEYNESALNAESLIIYEDAFALHSAFKKMRACIENDSELMNSSNSSDNRGKNKRVCLEKNSSVAKRNNTMNSTSESTDTEKTGENFDKQEVEAKSNDLKEESEKNVDASILTTEEENDDENSTDHFRSEKSERVDSKEETDLGEKREKRLHAIEAKRQIRLFLQNEKKPGEESDTDDNDTDDDSDTDDENDKDYDYYRDTKIPKMNTCTRSSSNKDEAETSSGLYNKNGFRTKRSSI